MRLGDRWVPVLRPSPDPLARSSDAASFLLVPYSNRLRDGRFRFEGATYQLANAKKHAIHGDVRDRPWRTVRSGATEALLRFDSSDFTDINFPFPFAAEFNLSLDGACLRTRLGLINAGTRRMPAGCGFHPYFARRLCEQDRVEIQLSVEGVYPGDDPLPTGPVVPVGPDQDFHRRRPLDPVLDHCFGGWDGRALIRWPQSGVELSLEAGKTLRHVIIYSPKDQPYFAVEPVSHANDGFNLFAGGQSGTGVVVLEPGRSLVADLSMTLSAGRSR